MQPVTAGSQNSRREEGGGGAAIMGEACTVRPVTFKTGQMGREVHIFWMQIYVWWEVPRSNCMTKQTENLTLHLWWSQNRTMQCLLKLNSSHYFAASTKVLFGPQYNSPGIAVTTRSLSSSVFITLWKPQSASTNSIFIRMIRSLLERLKIKIKAVTICFLHSNLWIHAAALFLSQWWGSQEMANVQFPPSQDTENRHLKVNIYQTLNHFPTSS